MKREKRLTKKERKASDRVANPGRAHTSSAGQQHNHGHIHCIACGKHLDPQSFGEPDGSAFLRCDHGTDFPHCVGCAAKAKELVEEHDRTGKGINKAAAWH